MSLDGEGTSYLNTSFTSNHYTIKARFKMGSWEGKLVYRNAKDGGSQRVDLMTNHNRIGVNSDGSDSLDHIFNTNQWYVCEVEVNSDDDKLNVWIETMASGLAGTGSP